MPVLAIRDSKDRTEAKKVIRRLNVYRKIFAYLGEEKSFESIAGGLYEQLKSGKRVRDLPVAAVEKKLRSKLKSIFSSVVEDLRNSGYGREADKIEDFVQRGELKNAYLTLKELRETEERNEAVESLLSRLDSTLYDLSLLRKLGADVEEISWQIAELLGVNRIKLPEKKLIFVNDEGGNAGCLISHYLKRMGIEHIYIGSKNFGDYIISSRFESSLDPILKAGKITEVVKEARGIVIIEDLNYLVASNSFGEVYQFLQFAKNVSKARIIVTGSYKLLSEREVTRLRGLFDSVTTLNTLFNLCSWGVVGLRSRANRGSLLLAKERVTDFPGEVMMIADFGGDKYVHPQRLDFEISDAIIRHLQEGDVVIDSIDLMIDENGLDRIYRWLKSIRDAALESGNRVYVVLGSLIARERDYLRPLLDADTFSLAKLDGKVLEAVSKKMEIIEKMVRRAMEKECAYNFEVIRQKYGRYQNHLSSLKDEVEEILSGGMEFNRECLLRTTPLRERIEAMVEHIERKTSEFNGILESIKRDLEIARHYVDVEDVQYCVDSAMGTMESGDADMALDKIRLCRSKMDRLMEEAMKEAERINQELQCIRELLPTYFQTKLSRYEDGIGSIADFTRLYEDIKMVALEKVESEYARLKRYSVVSGIPLENMDSLIHRMRFCEYWKRRNEFLEEFNRDRDRVAGLLRASTLKVLEFLENHGYEAPVKRDEVEIAGDVESVFNIAERVNNHLAMYISKGIEDLRKRYPDFAEKNEREIERIIVGVSINPVESITRYERLLEKLRREMGERSSRAIELKRKLQEYYDLFRSYGVPVNEWFPREIEKMEVVVESFEALFGELKPKVNVDVEDIFVDEDYNCHMFIAVKNEGNHEARNVRIEIYGALSMQEKVGTLNPGEERRMEVSGKIEKPDEGIKVDVFFEGVGGDIVNDSFEFEVNLRGYEISQATGVERCAHCRGKILKGMEMVVCSECGATYHRQCAERLKTCKICGNVFIF